MYDAIIIGRGPAGLSAALYTARANIKTLIIGKDNSRLRKADRIDNYFGFADSVSGEKLLDEGERQVLRFGADIEDDEVISLEMEKDESFKVTTSKRQFRCKALLLATGQPHKSVNIKNLTAFEGKGVSYCSTCDGFFYNSLKVGVLGYKEYAVHEAIELLAYTEDITIYTDGMKLDAGGKYMDEIKRFNINSRKIEKVEGKEFLQKIFFEDGTSNDIDGIFVAYDSASSVDFARKLGVLTDGNSVITDKNQQTNLEGLFAAGDCTGGLKQVATAVGQGAVAGKAMLDFIRRRK